VRKPLFALLILSTLAWNAHAAKRRSVRHPGVSTDPVAVNDAYVTGEGKALTVEAPGVLGNDTVNHGVIASYGAVTGNEQFVVGNATPTAQGGVITLRADGGFTYQPGAAFNGTDSFRYKLLTPSQASSTAGVTITVLAAAPDAASDTFSATVNAALDVAAPGVLANDTLRGATLVSYGAATGAEQTTIGAITPTSGGGTVSVDPTGALHYVPAASFSGADAFKYTVQNVGGSSSATVTINVQVPPADFIVTSPGFFYSFSGVNGQNPIITLTRGRTYRFEIHTDAFHPFEITGAPSGSVTNNNISEGTITFAVPASATNYNYRCSIHAFGNRLNTAP
jgi:hypothetical protein